MIKGTSYFGVRNPKWALADMRELATLGFTHVLHTYSEEDLKYYKETMREIIDGSVELGLKVYVNPWGVGRVFGGEAFSELTAGRPNLSQVAQDGTLKPAICPGTSEFMEFMQEWLEAVAETKAESVFWDEPHFYFSKGNLANWACRCGNCQKLYRKSFGTDMPLDLTAEVKAFREGLLVETLDQLTRAARKLGKKNTVCLLPPWFPAGIDDWEKIASLEAVDELASDPYQEHGDPPALVRRHYRETAEKLVKTAKAAGVGSQMWVKNYQIEAGRERDVAIAVEEAYAAGVRNIFCWSFRSTEYLSWLRSDNPELAWREFCDALLKL